LLLGLAAVAFVMGGTACGIRSSPGVVEASAPPPPTLDAQVVPPPKSEPLVPATSALPEPPPPALGAVYPPFKKTTLSLEQLAHLVEGVPELARVGGGLAMFDPGDSPYLRRSKADPSTREGTTITPLPLLWSPAEGVQLLVVTARGKEGSFVAAWWTLPDGQYRLASTYVMLDEVAPVALAFHPPERTLEWTTCWRCSGETGKIVRRADGRVVILPE
jgi:hypothetical protein